MTYSIVAMDPDSAELGVGIASHTLAVGAICPWAEPGVDVVVTQAYLEPGYGRDMLRRLDRGVGAAEALAELSAADALAATRQVAAVDVGGRVAVHDGAQCIREAGHVVGPAFSCQANMVRNPGVPEAMAEEFLAGTGTLATRLLAAVMAAEVVGGDIRGRQSAALRVVATTTQARMGGWLADLRVDDHPQPLEELSRLDLAGPAVSARVAQCGPDFEGYRR